MSRQAFAPTASRDRFAARAAAHRESNQAAGVMFPDGRHDWQGNPMSPAAWSYWTGKAYPVAWRSEAQAKGWRAEGLPALADAPLPVYCFQHKLVTLDRHGSIATTDGAYLASIDARGNVQQATRFQREERVIGRVAALLLPAYG